MRRRALAALAGHAAAAPLLLAAEQVDASEGPELRWRCPSSFPPSLDTIYGSAEVFATTLATITDGRFQIEVLPPGELMPAFDVLDAAAAGTVEVAHSCAYYFTDKDPAFAIGTALPFGLNNRLQNAWLEGGDGNAVLNAFFRTYGVVGLQCGNTGCQMGGWFKQDLTSAEELQGLRMRVVGLTGTVLATLGVETQALPGSDIVPALEEGRIDAAEWIGPYDDEKLGFDRVAKFYFYPGWWEPNTTLHLFVNADLWDSLPEAYRQAFTAAAGYANLYTMAKYDVQNPAALKRLVQRGVVLRPFTGDVMRQARTAAESMYAQFREESPAFNDIFEHWQAFRSDGYLWWLVNEIAMDAFMVRSRAETP